MLLWLLRAAYAALLLVVAGYAANVFAEQSDATRAVVVPLLILLFGAIILFTDIREKQKQITTITALYFGLLLGLLLGWLFSLAAEPLLDVVFNPGHPMVRVARVLIIAVSCYVTISTLLQTKDEFRFIIPYVEFSKQVKGGRPLVLDTSVIIDGRIADVCETRMIDTKLVIPRFVLQELQAVADSSDKLKRNRGRRGLDVLKRLQGNSRLDVQIHDGNIPELRTGERIRVDERLVILARALGGRVVTNDFNLNKVAQLQGVEVINLNEVANALKTVALPGEVLPVRLVKPGDQIGQGVGYLEDGTMVVVEQGRNLIGQEVSIVVTSVLQTPAGRMIFGRPDQRMSGTHTPVPGGSLGGQAGPGPGPPGDTPRSPRTLGVPMSRTLLLAPLLVAAGLTGHAADPQEKEKKDKGGSAGDLPPAAGSGSAATSDVEVVERTLAARKEYEAGLRKLREHYEKVGDKQRLKWAEDELMAFHLAFKPSYNLDVQDVPPPGLEAKVNVREANDLFKAAMAYKQKGSGNDYVLNQRRAEILLREVLEKYPNSDKIADVAYQLAEVYEGRAYRQYDRAARYYERSFQWMKGSRTDARLRAAVLYDRQLNERSKAIELYRSVVEHDTDGERIKQAEKRLAELTGGKK